MKNDIEIAQSAKMEPIINIAKKMILSFMENINVRYL